MDKIRCKDEILNFWFGDLQSEASQYATRVKLWFLKNAAVDQEIRDRFLPSYEQAIAGGFDDWQTSATGCLALIILLDQFPRNMFRGTARAFVADRQVLQVAKGAIAQGFDQHLPPLQRLFLYLPLEHSESLADQDQSVLLFQELIATSPELNDCLDYAIRHRDVIKRFGRFPHRNASLGRISSAAEIEFLNQPGSSF